MEPFKLVYGSRFIDLNKTFEEIRLAYVAIDKENNPDQTIILWYNYPDEPVKIKIEEYSGNPFPDLNSPFTALSPYYAELRDKTNAVRHKFINVLYSSEYKKITVEKAIAVLGELAGIGKDESEALIKLNIAKGDIRYVKQKTGNFIILSSVYSEIEDKKRFLSSMTDELESKSERVGLIINHSQTAGNYREKLLISILKKYVPSKYHVATGFIEGRSKQIDVIIYDQLNYIPLFREDDLVVVKPEAVRAVVEVKTTLDSTSLWDSLDGMNKIFKYSNHPVPVFKGIYAFESKYETTNSVVQRVKDFYNDPSNEYYSTQLHDIIDSICVPNKHIVFTDYITKNHKNYTGAISPAIFSFQNRGDVKVETASFLSDLFAHLDVNKVAKRINLGHFEMLGLEIKYSFEGFIHEKWEPQNCFRNEHDFSEDGIHKRLTEIDKWIKGDISSEELNDYYL